MNRENMIKAIRKKVTMKNYPNCKTYDEALKAECDYFNTIKDIVMPTYDLSSIILTLGDSFAYASYGYIVKMQDGFIMQQVCLWYANYTLEEQIEETIETIYNILYL